MRTARLISISLLIFALVTSVRSYPDGRNNSNIPPENTETRQDSNLANNLKVAVAWGLVPLSTEIALNVGKDFLKRNHYLFFLQMLSIHASNIRRSSSQHLTDNLSARLESFSYKSLSDEHFKKHTDELQNDLLFRSLFTFSILSMNAQKARKTYFRLQDILDNIAASASLALTDGDHNRAEALMALAAQVVVYIHPEAKASDGAGSINTHFTGNIDWAVVPEFRPGIHRHLQIMDPLVQRSALINLRYCDLLNQWRVSYADCSPYENGAVAELEGMAIIADQGEQPGIIKSILKDVPAAQIRNTIFIMGVSVPAVFLYFLNKRNNPVIYTIVDHFAKVSGMATTKSTIERFSSNSRRALENWGAIDTGKGSSTSRTGDFTNHYFNTLQKNATAILAEQPNFARSNAQRSIEALVINLSEAYRQQRLATVSASTGILASALVQNYRENVEVTPDDSLIKSILIAYRPLKNPEIIPDIERELAILDPEYESKAKVQQWYDHQINVWHKLSSDPDKPAYPNINWMTSGTEWQHNDDRNKNGDRGKNSASGYQDYLPDRETVATATIHGTALSYSILIAMLEPVTINRLMTSQPSFWNLTSYYLLLSMFDFGLRSLGEPAVVHLQTVIKNWIGSTTGILPSEDRDIQEELANKVNVINRKLSIEAQTSRSYRATLEALMTRYWSLSNYLLIQSPGYPLTQSAALLALAAYTQRYFHPEYTEDNLVMSALAIPRLIPGFEILKQQGEMDEYSRYVLSALKTYDSSFQKPDVSRAYLKILKSWGLESVPQVTGHSTDVLDSWASYGDYFLGGVGFSTQALVKALFHGNEVVSRSLANFFVNIFEYGTTDSLRKKIYAWSRLKMLNVVSFYPETEMIGANYANQEMTDSFRRQKFYFGKPELDMRTQLIQIITSIVNNYYQVIILIDNDRQNGNLSDDETQVKVQDLMALTLVRLILFAPDMAADDVYILQTVNVLTLPVRGELSVMGQPILNRVEALLDTLDLGDRDVFNDCMDKAKLMVDNWLQVDQETDL